MSQRTKNQNRALHKFFTLLADELNNAGLDMKKTLKPDIDIPWNAESVKSHLWKPLQDAQLGKTSTTELTTDEVNKVYETLNRHLAQKLGVSVPFPSLEDQMLEEI